MPFKIQAEKFCKICPKPFSVLPCQPCPLPSKSLSLCSAADWTTGRMRTKSAVTPTGVQSRAISSPSPPWLAGRRPKTLAMQMTQPGTLPKKTECYVCLSVLAVPDGRPDPTEGPLGVTVRDSSGGPKVSGSIQIGSEKGTFVGDQIF